MGDLISRSALLKKLESMTNDNEEHVRNNSHQFTYKELAYIICNQPTVYDVEKVVEELEEAKEKIATEDYCRTKHYVKNDCEHKDCFKCCAEYLIDIVRKGGVE